jgi:hypothetical protein
MATLGLVWIALAYPALAEDLRQGRGGDPTHIGNQPRGRPGPRTSRIAAPELVKLRAQAGELVRLSRAAEQAKASGRRSFVSMLRALSSPKLLGTIPSGKAITIVSLPTVRQQRAGGAIVETIDELVLTSHGPGLSRRENRYEAKVEDLKEEDGKLVGKIHVVPAQGGEKSFTRLAVTASDKAGKEAKDSEVYLNGVQHTRASYAHDVSKPWAADSFMSRYHLERPAAMKKAMVRVRRGIEALASEHKRELRTRGVSPSVTGGSSAPPVVPPQ